MKKYFLIFYFLFLLSNIKAISIKKNRNLFKNKLNTNNQKNKFNLKDEKKLVDNIVNYLIDVKDAAFITNNK
jgi:hypothetical protein